MAVTKRRTAPEIIGCWLGADMRDVSSGRYQSTRFAAPAVYVVDGDYYCAPAVGQKAPSGFSWERVGRVYERPVFRARGGVAECDRRKGGENA